MREFKMGITVVVLLASLLRLPCRFLGLLLVVGLEIIGASDDLRGWLAIHRLFYLLYNGVRRVIYFLAERRKDGL